MTDNYQHSSVLTEELIDKLKPSSGQNFIDCTLGGGGHAKAILEQTKPQGKLLGLDIDPQAVRASNACLALYKDRVIIVQDSYVRLKEIIKENLGQLGEVSGIVIDLGLSSHHLDSANRGFSFKDSGPLDMRFNPDAQTETASDIVLNWSTKDLGIIFREYGELPHAERLARGLTTWRQALALEDFVKQKQKMIKTSVLVSAILRILNISQSRLKAYRIHPATRVFQALRIAVNKELDNVTIFLPQALEALSPGGRLAVISFHSLEDRIVKRYFKDLARDCVCSLANPVCTCGHKAKVKIINKKVIMASAKELADNPRSRSAKMRVVAKI